MKEGITEKTKKITATTAKDINTLMNTLFQSLKGHKVKKKST